jgi:hypothetical protein
MRPHYGSIVDGAKIVMESAEHAAKEVLPRHWRLALLAWRA